MAKTAGYSSTPLAKKLGYQEGFKVALYNPPAYYFDLLKDLPTSVQFIGDQKVKKDLIHYFCTSLKALQQDLLKLRGEIEQHGMIWISWPKKSSKVETDINEDLIRSLALANSLVDVKVCAVDETWSGLKLVIRLKDRIK